MAAKPKTYTIRNKMTGEIVGYWDGIPGSDDAIKARLRQEFGQGRFQITYTGRKKVTDDATGKEKIVTHPVNQFFVVGNVSHSVNQQAGFGNGGHRQEPYREEYAPINNLGEIIANTRQILNDLQAMADNVAITRSNIEALMSEDEDGAFDDDGEKAGVADGELEAILKDSRYSWAIPLVIGGDKDALINGVAEKLKEDPTLLHDFISKLVGGAMGGE